MRTLFVLPVAILFGCAHQSGGQSQASMPPAQNQAAQAYAQPTAEQQSQLSAAQQSDLRSEQQAQQSQKTSEPQPVAGSDPASSPNTCGLVRVRFDTNEAVLHDDDKALLTSTADCLKNNQRLRVNIEGNADERGTIEHNQQLGQERAQVVSQFLENQGVSADQIRLVSFGEENPRCTASTKGCWAKNRRTAIRPTCRM